MGKVLLEFDHQLLIDQVATLSNKTSDEIESLLFKPPHDLENRFERGELNSNEFHASFCELAACDVSHDELMLAMADIFWLNTPIVHILAQLRGINFPMAVLSNTCAAHWDFATKKFAAIGKLFDHRVLSYEEKSMKPDGKIYQSAIRMANDLVNCQASEIFFVDDKSENVTAARSAGMQAEVFESASALAIQLKAGGIGIHA
jgi:putative hydrolase of the HAD superfamily